MAKTTTTVESYTAQGSLKAGASAAAIRSAYKIEVRFLGGLTPTQKAAFKTAADRWSRVIVGDVPSVTVDGEVIDDLVIEAEAVAIDGAGRALGQSQPTFLRPSSAGASAYLPAKGRMSFDTADLAAMEADGRLVDVIAHEMGHIIGIGTIWRYKGLLTGSGTADPQFTGANATREYGILKGTGPTPVPVENVGPVGSRDMHWRETIFKSELMSAVILGPHNPLSRMTIASLKDLGYVVDLNAAEPYGLPTGGFLASASTPLHLHRMRSPTTRVLPEDSLFGV